MVFYFSEDMRIKGILFNCVIYILLIKGLLVISFVEEVKFFFEEMKEEGLELNVFYYIVFIDGYVFKESIVISKY